MFGSRKPEAKEFKRWVCKSVLVLTDKRHSGNESLEGAKVAMPLLKMSE